MFPKRKRQLTGWRKRTLGHRTISEFALHKNNTRRASFLRGPMAYHEREDLSSCGQARLVLKEIKDSVSDYPDQILNQWQTEEPQKDP